MALMVTEEASAVLKKMLVDADGKPGQVFRMIPDKADAVILVLDEPTRWDHVVKHEGKIVLAIEPNFSASLSGRTLRVKHEANGPILTITTTRIADTKPSGS